MNCCEPDLLAGSAAPPLYPFFIFFFTWWWIRQLLNMRVFAPVLRSGAAFCGSRDPRLSHSERGGSAGVALWQKHKGATVALG